LQENIDQARVGCQKWKASHAAGDAMFQAAEHLKLGDVAR
jgi:hypothetical protein